jgi:hypothetical protein
MWAVHILLKVAPALSPAQNSLLDRLCVRATNSLAKISRSPPGSWRISRPILERIMRLLLLCASTLPPSLRRFFPPEANDNEFLEHLLTDWLARGGETFAVSTDGVQKAHTCACFNISKHRRTTRRLTRCRHHEIKMDNAG